LSLIFTFSIGSAEKFYDAKIITTNGGELHGLVTLPGNPGPSMLRFKESKDAKSALRTIRRWSRRSVATNINGTTWRRL
jgi:hypothetical protein